MEDSTDSFACSSSADDFSSSVVTSDTNNYSNAATTDNNEYSTSAHTNDTNAYSNPAFTSDSNDDYYVDNISQIHTQHEPGDTQHNTYPRESDDIYKSDINQLSPEITRQYNFEEIPKNFELYSKENDYNAINTLNAKQDYHNGNDEENIKHKIHNDNNSHNTCTDNSKEYKNKELSCSQIDNTCSEQSRSLQDDRHNTEQPTTKYESPSFILMGYLDQGLQETEDDLEKNSKTNKYNNNKYSKDKLNNNFDPSQTNIALAPKQNERFAPHWKQFLAAMGPYVMIFSGGLSCGFSATLLPQLKQEQSVILVNESSPSWIASMAALPMAPGCFIGGWIIEKWGRRCALRVLSLPFFLGWVLIATAPSLSLMLIGRFLNGISIGMLAPPMSLFISETSHPKLRGMFLAFLSFSLAVGIFVAHLIGTWVSWNWTAAICSVFPLISAGLLTFVPESPVWLLSKGRTEEAANSFYWLRGHKDEVVTELKGMMDKFKSVDSTSTPSWKEKFKNFNSPEFFKPLVIMVIIYVTCQFSGVHTITFYSVSIIEIAVGKGINKYVAMLTIDFLRTLTTLLTIMTSRKFPRRSLCIVSGILTGISMMSLALFLYFYKEIPESLTAVPLCFLSAYIVAINIGLMPLPWIIVGEIFPARVRSFGAGLASAIGYSSTFVVVKSAPGMMVDIGQVATFTFYGSVALVGTVVLYFVLPETKGRSMVEIEALFKKSKVKNNP